VSLEAELLQKADRYLDSAELLRHSGDLDSAISRAYYAAFFIAEALLDRQGLAFSSHKGVISAFGQEFAKTNRLDSRFHRLLIGAFEKRQRADYLSMPGFEDSDVIRLIDDVKEFRRSAEAWLNLPGLGP
jgi:uncharacterized protein (UPF0332 family)